MFREHTSHLHLVLTEIRSQVVSAQNALWGLKHFLIVSVNHAKVVRNTWKHTAFNSVHPECNPEAQ